MSSAAMAWALYRAPLAEPSRRLVLVYLAEHADKDGCGAFPSAASIAADLEMGLRTVKWHIAALEKAGLIRRGDQEMVSHFRADRRPVVWDLCTDVERPPQGREHSDGVQRAARRTPERGATDCTPIPPHDVQQTAPRADPRGAESRIHGVQPIAPKPSTKPSTSSYPPTPQATMTGNELLAEFVAAHRHRPPRAVTARVGQEVDRLLAEGVDAQFVRAGLIALHARSNLGPGMLPMLVNEAMNPPRQQSRQEIPARPRRMTAAERTAAILDATEAKFAAQDAPGWEPHVIDGQLA